MSGQFPKDWQIVKEEIIKNLPGQTLVVFSNPFQKSSIKKHSFKHTDSGKYVHEYIEQNQSFTKILTRVAWMKSLDIKVLEYKQLQVNLKDTRLQLMHNGKGKGKLKQAAADQRPKVTLENSKFYLVPPDRPYLHRLGICTADGMVKPSMYAKYRQVNKFIEIIEQTVDIERVESVLDFGCGKGYLTFALYDYLSQKGKAVEVVGIDLKEEVIKQCSELAHELKFKGLRFKHGDISTVSDAQCDLMIALHACDIATDYALHHALKNQSRYILASPCCHKQVRSLMKSKSEVDVIIRHGIYKERQAEMVTDTLRCLLLEGKGYKTDIFEFISTEHTGKNTMIRAVFTGENKDTASSIERIKQQFGVEGEQYLETLLQT